MNCPYCGWLDTGIPVNRFTHEPEKLADCSNCGEAVFAVGTRREDEETRLATVAEGERREETFAELLVEEFRGADHRDRGKYSDIDRDILDENGDIAYHAEFKERTCTLNGYRETRFPYAKMEKAAELIEETGKPVFIILKFVDAWTFLTVREDDIEYEEGEIFTPNYRGSDAETEHQRSVDIPVYDLTVMPLREYCMGPEEIRDELVA